MLNMNILSEVSNKSGFDISEENITSLDRIRNETLQSNLKQNFRSDHSNQSSGVKEQSIKSVQCIINKMDKNSNIIYYNGYYKFEEELGNIDPYEETNQYGSAIYLKDKDHVINHKNIQQLNKELRKQNNNTKENFHNQFKINEPKFDLNKIPHSESVNIDLDYLDTNDQNSYTYSNNDIHLQEKSEKLQKNTKIDSDLAEISRFLQKQKKK